jgi:hypothetical protein
MNWDKMCKLCGRQEQSVSCNNAECFDDYIDNGHCRDKNDNAIPPVGCEDHYRICSLNDCHQECSCQDFGG